MPHCGLTIWAEGGILLPWRESFVCNIRERFII